MPQEYDYTLRLEAEDLYVIDGLTYEQVADKTKVALTTVRSWSEKGDWRKKRLEHRESLRSIKTNAFKLRQALLQKATDSLDPQDIYAAAALERLAASRERKAGEAAPAVDRPALFLEDLEFIASTLKEIDPEGLKVLARNFDTIVKRFKDTHAQTA